MYKKAKNYNTKKGLRPNDTVYTNKLKNYKLKIMQKFGLNPCHLGMQSKVKFKAFQDYLSYASKLLNHV